jgi:hypothetical protein
MWLQRRKILSTFLEIIIFCSLFEAEGLGYLDLGSKMLSHASLELFVKVLSNFDG